VTLDAALLEFAYRRSLERVAEAFASEPSLALLEKVAETARVLAQLPFQVDLWRAQNLFYQVLQRRYPELQEAARRGEDTARRWLETFDPLCHVLRVKVGQ
jgi:hypothetical protein